MFAISLRLVAVPSFEFHTILIVVLCFFALFLVIRFLPRKLFCAIGLHDPVDHNERVDCFEVTTIRKCRHCDEVLSHGRHWDTEHDAIETTGRVVCSRCGLERKYVTCPKCEGKMQVPRYEKGEYSNGNAPYEVDVETGDTIVCPDCAGRGESACVRMKPTSVGFLNKK